MYVIYALVDPRDNTVHYVGCTQNVYDRFIAHIQCSGNNYAKNAWIHELRTINKMVIMETLEEVEDRQQAEEREAYWVKHFQSLREPVANISKTSSARRAKRTNLRLGRTISEQFLQFLPFSDENTTSQEAVSPKSEVTPATKTDAVSSEKKEQIRRLVEKTTLPWREIASAVGLASEKYPLFRAVVAELGYDTSIRRGGRKGGPA